MSTKKFRCTGDLLRFGATLDVECLGCGHQARFHPDQLWPLTGYIERKFHSSQLPAIARRMRCSKCGGRRIDWWPKNRD